LLKTFFAPFDPADVNCQEFEGRPSATPRIKGTAIESDWSARFLRATIVAQRGSFKVHESILPHRVNACVRRSDLRAVMALRAGRASSSNLMIYLSKPTAT